MSATNSFARSPTFSRASATIAGEMSQAVTSQPCSSIGRKLLPVPQPTSSSRLPWIPCFSSFGISCAEPEVVVVVSGEVVVGGSDRLIGDFGPLRSLLPPMSPATI